MNRLVRTLRDGRYVEQRLYDADSRLIYQAAMVDPDPVDAGKGSFLQHSVGQIAEDRIKGYNEGVPQADQLPDNQRTFRYDANGRLISQRVNTIVGELDYLVDYSGSDSYDAAGNILSYHIVKYGDNGYTNTFTNHLVRHEGYIIDRTVGTSTLYEDGSITKQYDPYGNLIAITDEKGDANNRRYYNDASGQALLVQQGDNVQRQLIANGQVLGRYGTGPNPVTPKDDDANPQFTAGADLNFTYQVVNDRHPGTMPTGYSVQPGDTLQGIAKQTYGDPSYWYRIAEANGLDPKAALHPGQQLQLPTLAGTTFNRADSMRPYDASLVIGDTTPTMPPPPPDDGGCGVLGMLLVIIVAVVATVLTAGAAAAALGATATAAGGTSLAALGTAALTGGTLVGAGGVALGAVAGMAAAVAGGIAGSILSQGVGIAIGVQDHFSWSGVALGALSAGVSAGVGGAASGFLAGEETLAVASRAVVSSAITQGIGVATGLQDHFSWTSVAAAGIGAGVGSMVGQGLQNTAFQNAFGKYGVAAVSGFAGGAAAAIARGGRISVTQVAADAFGNALGNSLGELMSSARPQDPALGNTFAEDGALRRQANPLLASDPQADTISGSAAPPGMGGRPLVNSVVFNGGSNYEAQWRINQGMVDGSANATTAATESNDPNSANYRNGLDIESDNADRNGTGPIRTMTSVTVSRGDSVEKLAKDIYGDQWRAGMATLIRDNGLQLNQWGSPIIRDGQSLSAWDLSPYSEEGLQRLGRASNAIEANNSRGLAARAELEAQKAALEAQTAADSERYREANRFAAMSRSASDGGPALSNLLGSSASSQSDGTFGNRSAMIAAAALGGEFSVMADGLPADIASGYAGPGRAIADPLARGITVANDTLHDLKESAKDLIVKGGAWGLQRGGIVGNAAYYAGGLAYVVDDILQPGNLLEAGLLAGGPAIGKAASAGVSFLNKLPVLGSDVGEVAGRGVYELAENLANRIGGMQDSLGLRLGVVDSNGARLRSVAELGEASSTQDISSSSLGKFLGEGGNKYVYAYSDTQAVAILKAGKNPQLITDELMMLNQLNDMGIPTVNARGVAVDGRPAMLMDQFAQGSKDIVALQNGKVRIGGESPLLNAQSISDLENIRSTMVHNNVQINDLQFLISSQGRVVVADPLAVNLNKAPSINNLRMIDLLIQSAKKNGPFQ